MVLITENAFKFILGIATTLLVMAIAYCKWSFTYWKRKGVQHPSPIIPFGNVAASVFQKIAIGVSFRDVYREYKNKCCKYCGMYFFLAPVLLITDLDLVKNILTKDFDHFTDHGIYTNEEREPLTGGLFSLNGLRWRNLRIKITPTFTSGKMKMMFCTLVDCSHGLIDVVDKVVENRGVLDIKDVVARYTTDVIGSCAFGLECNSLKNPNAEFRCFGRKIFQVNKLQALARALSLSSPKLMEKLGLTIFDKGVSDFFMGIVKETVAYREKNHVVRKDFMHLLIQLKNNINLKDEEQPAETNSDGCEVGRTLTMNELAAHAFIFFAAGFETSSTTLTFCFYELATNADIQEKLRNEIKVALERHHGELTYDAIMEMQYMDRCIQETLRKYPTIPFLIRKCTKEYHVPDSDLVLEKGTLVFIPTLGIHRDAEYYPEPDKFDPERFSPENKAKRHHFSWLPFGEGPRACIGMRFAMMQTKVALAVLLKHYKFTLNAKTRTPISFNCTGANLGVRGDVWLDVEKLSE